MTGELGNPEQQREEHQIDARFTIVERLGNGGIRLSTHPDYLEVITDPITGTTRTRSTVLDTPEGRARFEELQRNRQNISVHGD